MHRSIEYVKMILLKRFGKEIRNTCKYIRASNGFDRGLAAGEAIRCDTLIAKLKINAEDNLAYAA